MIFPTFKLVLITVEPLGRLESVLTLTHGPEDVELLPLHGIGLINLVLDSLDPIVDGPLFVLDVAFAGFDPSDFVLP